jgi:pimeloyl-ACP methyl ester carboxylesterase
MARTMFGGDGYMKITERAPESPATRAMAGAYDATISAVGLHAMTPGNVRREMGEIDRPVFVALGGRDMTGPAHLIGPDYVNCPDFTRYVIDGAGHHLFVVPEAPVLYARIAGWARNIAT